MSNKNLTDMSREEKEKFAEQKMKEMKLKNLELQRRFAEVTTDRIAAESNNSSITNSAKALKQEDTFKQERTISDEFKVKKYERSTTRSTREWDQDKFDDKDWETHKHQGFKEYRLDYHDKKERHFKTSYDKRSSKSYNDRYNMHHYRDNSVKKSKESRYQSSEYSMKSQHEKNRSYYPSESRKYAYKNQSSSSSNSEYKYKKINRVRSSNKEKSSLWRSDRINEDRDKQDRTQEWVQSLNESSFEQDNVKKSVSHKNYSKFERFEHSDYSSTDSESEDNCNKESVKPTINEKENQMKEIKLKKNLESPNADSKKIEEESKKSSIPNKKYTHSNSAAKSSSSLGLHSGNRFADNSRSNLARKVSSRDVESSLLQKSTNNGKNNNFLNTEKGFKKGTKRDPENNSPDRYKNQVKQRKFLGQSENDSQYYAASENKGKKVEQYCYKNKKTGSNVDSLNQAQDDGIWETLDQQDDKWKESEENDEICSKEKETHFKVKSPTVSDDGGWCTVEEGEIVSDDSGHKHTK